MPRFVLLISLFLSLLGCQSTKQTVPPAPEPEPAAIPPAVQVDRSNRTDEWQLDAVAESPKQWTGVTVSKGNRIFVNFPRWSAVVPTSVAELLPDGSLHPYPSHSWNDYARVLGALKVDPMDAPFVAVQSVVADKDDFLWVLDTGNPRFEGVIEGAARLIRIDLKTDQVAQIISFGDDVVPENAYLNDVRIDAAREFAYITDSHASAIIAVNLATTQAIRVLDDHPSTQANIEQITIDGVPWLNENEEPRQVHADGIAMTADGDFLFYQALTGETLYRLPTEPLRKLFGGGNTDTNIEQYVEKVAITGASDGILLVHNWLYLTSIENNAIRRIYLPRFVLRGKEPAKQTGDVLISEPELQTIAQGKELAWPDTLAADEEGTIYFTTSQIHLGTKEKTSYQLYKLTEKGK